jgi:hypothetical protein
VAAGWPPVADLTDRAYCGNFILSQGIEKGPEPRGLPAWSGANADYPLPKILRRKWAKPDFFFGLGLAADVADAAWSVGAGSSGGAAFAEELSAGTCGSQTTPGYKGSLQAGLGGGTIPESDEAGIPTLREVSPL